MTEYNEKAVARKRPVNIVAIGAILVILALGTVLLINFLPGQSEGKSGAAATVNGEVITMDELYEVMLKEGGRDFLDRLIANRLILQEGEKLGITVSDEEIDAEIQSVINENFYGNVEIFRQAIEQYGTTEEAIRDDLSIEMVLRKIAKSQIEVTDEVAREYFLSNQGLYNISEQVEARHILLETKEQAEELIQLLDSGSDFAELARENSIDTVSRADGGKLGFFGRGEMVPEFENIAFNLALNQHSDAVESQFGFHIIEVLDRNAAREVSYEEVQDKVKGDLSERLVSEKMSEIINLLWETADIDYKLS
ncbi:MAG: peptidylprolyl isomerase [Bacillota bacterium]|nr:peptidylprolyl isomerase [Bacillota bacterium]